MEIANIHVARLQLSKLVDRALKGEEVIIARAGTPLVRLVPVGRDESPRRGGQWKGKVRIAEDFDELPDDVAHAFGVDVESPSCSTPNTPLWRLDDAGRLS
jgi:prevent-host-death family protein